MSTKGIWRGLLWGLIILSVGFLFFTPYNLLLDKAVSVLPWVGSAVIVAEALFIVGLLIMAVAVGSKIRNPLKLRRELKNILRATTSTRLFWAGFWINMVGAVGSSALISVALFIILPAESWALVIIPMADLLATAALRLWVIRSHARERDLSS